MSVQITPLPAPAAPAGQSMFKSWKFWSVMAVLAGLVALFSYGFTKDPKLVPSPLVGLAAPPFSVDQINGTGHADLASLKGTPFILNFWASWCMACQDEAAILEAAHRQYELNGHQIRVIGVAIQDTPDKALGFAKHFGKTYFLGLDDAQGDISLSYGLYGVPETFFVDGNGRIAFKQIGPVTKDVIDEQVAKLTATTKAGS
jgi:cytochrome c biogenesis protein CcmG, thiol:disulfide interchange protein DsbE